MTAEMLERSLTGWVIRYQSGFFEVETGEGLFTCQLRGKLKRGPKTSDLLTIGDRVEIATQRDGSGAIESILPRKSALVRTAPTSRGDYRQVLLANADQVVLVFACRDPEPHVRMLDRFLVICEKQELKPLIVINKVDLLHLNEVRAVFDRYLDIGYPVIYTSVRAHLGIEDLREKLTGKISALAGPSGVGKTSLLNALQPALGLAVREVSKLTARGQHTTVMRQLFKLEGGGYLADMPGIRALALWDTSPEELDGYFPEFRDKVEHCQFNDCTHRNETGCAVLSAIASGEIHPERYESYLRLRYHETGGY
jgi:ribosome biogenesis GTPase